MVALDRLRTLLDIDIDTAEDHEALTANRKIVASAARDVLATLVKVDENRLRKQQIDTLPSLLAEIAEFERGQLTTD